MNHAVVFLGILGEEIFVFTYIEGGGGAQVAAGSHMGKNIRRMDGVPVQELLAVLDDGQAGQGDVVLSDLRGRKVAGAVGNNFDLHKDAPFCFYRERSL